ncbi:SMI1/KNR4 family protein [Bacillus massiliigorillae]|uniref:SMI1/KNR4 family protein n=1 Tax=Bacillus massiliigorillae TaxID=1243664 RepID=UPI0003A870FD|nr:SMI1/KNR4 family protein [Bacillus massiliigorillae]
MNKNYYDGDDFWNEKAPPVSDEIVKKAELKLGVKLPKEYIKLLKESNGGTLHFTKVCINPYGKCEIPYLLGIDLENINEDDNEGIFSFVEDIKEYSLPENIVLLAWETYPHFCFALDYTNCKENPAVVYFYENYLGDNGPYSKTLVALTFKEFLSLLYQQSTLKPSR